MSKLNMDVLKECIGRIISTKKPRKFVETVELQVMLKVALTHLTPLRTTIPRKTNVLQDP